MCEHTSIHEKEQGQRAAWGKLEALLASVHSQPTDLTPEEIEAEITLALEETRRPSYSSTRAACVFPC